MLCEGEPFRVVMNVDDMDGLAAWQKLHQLYNPRTMARVMTRLMKAVTPKRVQDVKQMMAAIEEWESNLRELEKEHGEELKPLTKMAILTMMCPSGVQDLVFQHLDEKSTYADVEEQDRGLGEQPRDDGRRTHDDGDGECRGGEMV